MNTPFCVLMNRYSLFFFSELTFFFQKTPFYASELKINLTWIYFLHQNYNRANLIRLSAYVVDYLLFS